jgi:serine/threonine-protein kinase 11
MGDISGSPALQTPEITIGQGKNDFDGSKRDVWSLGVSLFESFFVFLPFEGDDIFQIASPIQNNPISIPSS